MAGHFAQSGDVPLTGVCHALKKTASEGGVPQEPGA